MTLYYHFTRAWGFSKNVLTTSRMQIGYFIVKDKRWFQNSGLHASGLRITWGDFEKYCVPDPFPEILMPLVWRKAQKSAVLTSSPGHSFKCTASLKLQLLIVEWSTPECLFYFTLTDPAIHICVYHIHTQTQTRIPVCIL